MRKTLIAAALFAFAGSAFAAPVTYKLDPGHTNVLASWNHFGFSNPSANFGQADGTLVYDADNVSASSVQVTLPLTGLSALADQFYDHLTSDKWFDAAKYPAATFKSTKVEAAGEGRLTVYLKNGSILFNVDCLIWAIGREPASDKLSLAAAGVKTDKDGKYAIYTIRPAAYATQDSPAHIHPIIIEPNREKSYYIDDFVFDDDILLTTARRIKMENRGGSGVVRFVQVGDLFVGERDIILGSNIPNYP